MTFTRAEKYAAAVREVNMRRRVYLKWVRDGRMTQAEADRGIEIMEAIAKDYAGPAVQGEMFREPA